MKKFEYTDTVLQREASTANQTTDHRWQASARGGHRGKEPRAKAKTATERHKLWEKSGRKYSRPKTTAAKVLIGNTGGSGSMVQPDMTADHISNSDNGLRLKDPAIGAQRDPDSRTIE